MQDFRKLREWHESQDLSDRIVKVTKNFPPVHRFGLTDQLSRAADSVTNNLAEGCGRATKADKLKYFHIALGSVNEVDNCLLRAHRSELLSVPVYQSFLKQVVDVRKMLTSLIVTVRNAPGR
jgi:four helix bundle protein